MLLSPMTITIFLFFHVEDNKIVEVKMILIMCQPKLKFILKCNEIEYPLYKFCWKNIIKKSFQKKYISIFLFLFSKLIKCHHIIVGHILLNKRSKFIIFNGWGDLSSYNQLIKDRQLWHNFILRYILRQQNLKNVFRYLFLW
jgi:hypothetical protein